MVTGAASGNRPRGRQGVRRRRDERLARRSSRRGPWRRPAPRSLRSRPSRSVRCRPTSRTGRRWRPSPPASARAGPPAVVMLNAGTEAGGKLFSDLDVWQRILGTNLWGVVNGIHAFAPGMIAGGKPGAIVVTGSKQGHHHAPGQHALQRLQGGREGGDRGARLRPARTRRLPDERPPSDPGLRLHRSDKARGVAEKPAGAWTPEEDGGVHAGAGWRLATSTSSAPDNETHPCAGREADRLGDRRHRREPSGAVALASGLLGGRSSGPWRDDMRCRGRTPPARGRAAEKAVTPALAYATPAPSVAPRPIRSRAPRADPEPAAWPPSSPSPPSTASCSARRAT